ncbi:MAG: hypothetical protein WCO63_16215 [Bacteroidota bacterium]
MKKSISEFNDQDIILKTAILITLVSIVIFVCFTVLLFTNNYLNFSLNISPELASNIGSLYGGLFGSIWTLVGVILLYKTLMLQKEDLTKTKNIMLDQSFDNKFFNFLNHFLNRNNEIREKFDQCKTQGLLYNAHIAAGVNEKLIYNSLKEFLIIPNKNDLKVYPWFVSYFKSLEFLIVQIEERFDKSKEHYSSILLANLSDNEIQFICYYYYIFFDETHKGNGKPNIIKESGIFENVDVSSFYDFYDPRTGIFDEIVKADNFNY